MREYRPALNHVVEQQVLPQHVAGEVVLHVAPDGVDVVRAVLPIVELDHEPIGCLWVHSFPDALELERLQLLPEVQGRGIGTHLVERLIATASAAGKSVRLQVFRTSPAQRLYARLGFEVLDRTETHEIMERPA